MSTIIAGPEFTNTLANGLALPPARRDLLLQNLQILMQLFLRFSTYGSWMAGSKS